MGPGDDNDSAKDSPQYDWPNGVMLSEVDQAQQLASAKEHEEAARRQDLMSISKGRAQYKKLFIAAGILEESRVKTRGLYSFLTAPFQSASNFFKSKIASLRCLTWHLLLSLL